MAELWALLISAQENPTGIPDSLLELRKEEIAKKRVNFFFLILIIISSLINVNFFLGKGRKRSR